MSAEPPHLTNEAEPKRALIAVALLELRDATGIDEGEAEVEGWAAWYDDVVGNVSSLEQLAGAMRVELTRRHGERALAKGEQQGKNQPRSKSDLLPSRPAEGLAPSLPKVRLPYGARVIGNHPNAVKKYIRKTVSRDDVPSVAGALRAIRTSNKGHGAKADRRLGGSKSLARIYDIFQRRAAGTWQPLQII